MTSDILDRALYIFGPSARLGLLAHGRQVNELVIPVARKKLLAVVTHRGGDNLFGDRDQFSNRLRTEFFLDQ